MRKNVFLIDFSPIEVVFFHFLVFEQRAQLFSGALLRSIGSLFVETSYFKPVSAFFPYLTTEKSLKLLSRLS